MNTIKNNIILKVELLALITSVILVFLTTVGRLSSLPTVLVLATLSMYFFPVKFLFPNRNLYLIISGIILALSLASGVLLLYKDFDILSTILCFLNFGYLIYLGFFVGNDKLPIQKYRYLVLIHFLVLFILF
ncbi:hypothetical protein [Lacinutrix undariae]